jgi:hypothetical protein
MRAYHVIESCKPEVHVFEWWLELQIHGAVM